MADKQLSILHIEDDHVDQMVVERVLKRLNIANPLYHAQNGEEALDMLRGENGQTKLDPMPQLILLDINMPRMNGIEFLKELRSDDRIRHISVLIMTTSNDDEDRKEAYYYNVTGYVLKPVDITQFEATFKILADYWRLCEQP
jgi:CheY-like chemotaxis protein